MEEGKYIAKLLENKLGGTPSEKLKAYQTASPFCYSAENGGNAKWLSNTPIRIYHEPDVNWWIENRRQDYYDMNSIDCAALIDQLLINGNKEAELITTSGKGYREGGMRHPHSSSIIDESDLMQWVEEKLGIATKIVKKTPYFLPTLEKWITEKFSFPIEFAPQIPYQGMEDIRFSPTWGTPETDGYWSYTFLWWLDGKVILEEKTLESYLQAYYQGLVNRNIMPRNIPANKLIPTNAALKKVTTVADDTQTFSGVINMLDYMTQKPIALNIEIHLKKCSTLAKTAIIFEVSPQSTNHSTWQLLKKVQEGFYCTE